MGYSRLIRYVCKFETLVRFAVSKEFMGLIGSATPLPAEDLRNNTNDGAEMGNVPEKLNFSSRLGRWVLTSQGFEQALFINDNCRVFIKRNLYQMALCVCVWHKAPVTQADICQGGREGQLQDMGHSEFSSRAASHQFYHLKIKYPLAK